MEAPPALSATRASPPGDHSVAFFWDVENCSVSINADIHALVRELRSLFVPSASAVSYNCVCREGFLLAELRSKLEAAGMVILETSSRKHNAADFRLLDAIDTFARATPPPATVVLISGDSDFTAKVQDLKERGYEVVLVHGPMARASFLRTASRTYEWNLLKSACGDAPSISSDQASLTERPFCIHNEQCEDLRASHRNSTRHRLPDGHEELILTLTVIPPSEYRLIVGPKYTTLQSIRATTGARISVPKPNTDDPIGIWITGRPDCVRAAQIRLQDYFGPGARRAPQRPRPAAPEVSVARPLDPPDGYVVERVPIKRTVYAKIDVAGQDFAGCNLSYSAYEILTIKGRPQQVRECKAIVLECVAKAEAEIAKTSASESSSNCSCM